MQRINRKADYKARLKHPPKKDWRKNLHESEIKYQAPEPAPQVHAAFLPEAGNRHTGGFSTLIMVSVVGHAVLHTAQAANVPQHNAYSRCNTTKRLTPAFFQPHAYYSSTSTQTADVRSEKHKRHR